MLVRLVILHDQGQITDNQWQAILALKSHKESIDRNLRATIQADVRLMKEMTKDERPEDDLEDLYWRVRMVFPKPRTVSIFRTNALIKLPTDQIQPAQRGFPHAAPARKLPRPRRRTNQPFLPPKCPSPLRRSRTSPPLIPQNREERRDYNHLYRSFKALRGTAGGIVHGLRF